MTHLFSVSLKSNSNLSMLSQVHSCVSSSLSGTMPANAPFSTQKTTSTVRTLDIQLPEAEHPEQT